MLVLAGCGPQDTGETATATETGTGTTEQTTEQATEQTTTSPTEQTTEQTTEESTEGEAPVEPCAFKRACGVQEVCEPGWEEGSKPIPNCVEPNGVSSLCVWQFLRDGDFEQANINATSNSFGALSYALIVTDASKREVLVEELSFSYDWAVQRHCTLRSAAFFQGCIDTPQDDCYVPDAWLEDCCELPAGQWLEGCDEIAQAQCTE